MLTYKRPRDFVTRLGLSTVSFYFSKALLYKTSKSASDRCCLKQSRSRISFLSHGTQIPGKLLDSESSSCFFILCIEKKRINTSESTIVRVWPSKSLGSSCEALSLARWTDSCHSCKEIADGVLRVHRRSQRGCLVHTRRPSV